ncbi:alpha/beta hydrolase [Endothiovibrio diazotrophicus]
MKRLLRRILFLLLPLAALPASADTLVMVQGYLGDGHDWRASGVARPLLDAGWADGGQLLLTPGAVRSDLPQPSAAKRFYTVVLPSEAPMMAQLGFLERYMDFVEARHGSERLFLVGHSAGGVLARLYMVRHPKAGVDGLITIASPNLGSELAELGNDVGNSPLGWVTPLMGLSTINRSQGLYYDLGRPRPGSLLHWLNAQPHPKARYVAVIREAGFPFGPGDEVVPAWSQDLNQVPALRGHAMVIPTAGGHGMRIEDGALIADLLRS